MDDLTISYKGSQIASMDASGTKTLLTKAKYCEDDISIHFKKTGDAVAEGNSSISVDDAKSGNACSLIQYGVCEQDVQTNAISCNNGVLSVSSGEIVTTAANSETLTVGSQTTTVDNLYSVNNVRDEQEFMTGTVVHKTAACIYDGTQPVGDRYISSTGAKDNGAIIIYPLETEYTNSSLVSFTEDTVRDVNLLEASIEPIQNLNGYNNPWPAGGGANKLNPHLYSGMTYNPTVGTTVTLTDSPAQFTDNGDGTFELTTSATWQCYTMLARIDESNWWVKCSLSSSGNMMTSIGCLDENFKVLTNSNSTSTSQSFDNQITIPSEAAYYFILFTNGASATATITVTEPQVINGSSSPTAWAPYSNICPISGLTGLSVYRTGKNLGEFENGYNIVANGSIGVNAKRCATVNPIKIFNGVSYVFTSETGLQCIYAVFNGNTLVRRTSGIASGSTLDTSGGTDLYVCAYGSSDYTATVETDKPMVRSSSSSSDYEPCNGNTYSSDWTSTAGTVYGGTVDVVTGQLTVDKASVDLGSIYWTYESGYTYPYFIGTMPNDCVVGSTVQEQISVLCSIYESIQNIGASLFRTQDHNFQCCLNSNVSTKRLLVQNTAYTDAATFKTAMAGVQLVYDLETPITYQLTPYEINTVLGTNYIFASSASSIKVAISNPVIEYVTPHPFTLSSGSNTITASNLSVSSVPLRLEYFDQDNGPWKRIGETEFEITTSSTTATDVGYIDVLKSEVDDVNKVLCLQVVRTSYPYTSRYHGSIYFIVCDSDNPRINRYGGGASYSGVISFPSGNPKLSAVSVTTTPSGGSVYPVMGVYDSDYYRITLKGKSSDSYTVIGTFEAKVYLVDWPDGINPFEGVYS